jgi:hypothetical protein
MDNNKESDGRRSSKGCQNGKLPSMKQCMLVQHVWEPPGVAFRGKSHHAPAVLKRLAIHLCCSKHDNPNLGLLAHHSTLQHEASAFRSASCKKAQEKEASLPTKNTKNKADRSA